jgi:hypothetical protein
MGGEIEMPGRVLIFSAKAVKPVMLGKGKPATAEYGGRLIGLLAGSPATAIYPQTIGSVCTGLKVNPGHAGFPKIHKRIEFVHIMLIMDRVGITGTVQSLRAYCTET